MKRKIQKWLSVQIAKHPGRVVLVSILLFNINFFIVATLAIRKMSIKGTEKMPFFQVAFSTIKRILDPWCVQFVVGLC